MVDLLRLGMLLGLDSFLVGVALGVQHPNTRRHCELALAFGTCDGIAYVAGSLCGSHGLRASWDWLSSGGGSFAWLGAVGLFAYGLRLLGLAARERGAQSRIGGLAFLLPVALGADNFVAALQRLSASNAMPLEATLAAAESGALALAGIALGALLQRPALLRSRWAPGVACMSVGLVLAFQKTLGL